MIKNIIWLISLVLYGMYMNDIKLMYFSGIIYCLIGIIEQYAVHNALLVNYTVYFFRDNCLLNVNGRVAARGVALKNILESDTAAVDAYADYVDFLKKM